MSVSSLQKPSSLDFKVKNSDMYGERNKTDMIKVVGMIQIMNCLLEHLSEHIFAYKLSVQVGTEDKSTLNTSFQHYINILS